MNEVINGSENEGRKPSIIKNYPRNSTVICELKLSDMSTQIHTHIHIHKYLYRLVKTLPRNNILFANVQETFLKKESAQCKSV